MNEFQKFLLFILLFGVFIMVLKVFVLQRQFPPQKKIIWRQKCPNAHIITVTYGGQLANNIWEYMSLLSVMHLHEDKFNFVAYIPAVMKGKLEFVFEKQVLIPLINALEVSRITKSCLMHKPYVLQMNESFNCHELYGKTKRVVVLAKYSARYKDILEYGINKIKNKLRFHKKYIEYSDKLLNQIKSKFKLSKKKVTYVGMHYRGNDYVDFLQRNYKNSFRGPPNSTFYIKAMNYFKEKYETVVYILITIDFQWLEENQPFLEKNNNLIVVPNRKDFIKDLALLSHCNHSIISYGTYGTTTALFAQGTTFAYDLGLPLDYRGSTIAMGIAEILPNWHLLA